MSKCKFDILMAKNLLFAWTSLKFPKMSNVRTVQVLIGWTSIFINILKHFYREGSFTYFDQRNVNKSVTSIDFTLIF